MIKRIWKDPVWSKVIAYGIIALISATIIWIKSIIDETSLIETLKNLITLKVPLIYIIIGLILLVIIRTILNKKGKTTLPDFIQYKKDFFEGIEWRWIWRWSNVTASWNIYDLKPCCNKDKCGTAMELTSFSDRTYATCPRCDNHINKMKSDEKIRSVIVDNVKRDLYLNKI